jgi:hypothetical protein
MGENPLPNANGIRVAIERLRNEVEWFRARLQVAYDRIAHLETGDSERVSRSDPSNKKSGNTRFNGPQRETLKCGGIIRAGRD